MHRLQHQGWSRNKLNELGFVGRGKSRHRPRNDATLYGGGYPFIQTGDVKAADLYLSEFTQTYNEKGLAQSKLWEPETLCITIAANIAETAILKIKACFPDSIVGFVADPEKTDVRFIKYYIDTIKLSMQNVSRGTTQDNLSVDKLLLFDFMIPPLETQRKIASILSAYDDLIENNTRRIKILEEMARMIYREWFINFRFPGHEQVKMVDSSLGMIPEGWEAGQLSDIATIIPGYAFKSSDWTESGVPVIKIKNIQEDGTVNTDEADFVSGCVITKKIEKFLLNHGDILIAMTGATAGKVGRLRSKISMGLNQRVAKIQARKPYEVFVWHSVSNESARKLLFGLADGAAQPNMSGSQIESIKLCIPDENVLQQFNVASMPMLHETDVLYLKNQNLRKTRDLLLPKLISGDVTLRISDKYEEEKL